MIKEITENEGWSNKLDKANIKMYLKKNSMYCKECPFFKVEAIFPVKEGFTLHQIDEIVISVIIYYFTLTLTIDIIVMIALQYRKENEMGQQSNGICGTGQKIE